MFYTALMVTLSAFACSDAFACSRTAIPLWKLLRISHLDVADLHLASIARNSGRKISHMLRSK